MSQIFISYSRVDTAFVEIFIRRLQRAFPDLKIWHDQAPHGLIGGGNWWDDILSAIAASDVFIYILSNESVNSLYCQAEFTEARRLQKRIITVQARDKTELTDDLDDIQLINMKDGIDHSEVFASLVAAVNLRLREAQKYRKARPLWKSATPKPQKETPPDRDDDTPEVETPPLACPPAEKKARHHPRSGARWLTMGVFVGVILGVAALAFTAFQLLRPAQTNISAPPLQSPAAPLEALTPTLSSFEQLQTAQMQIAESATAQAAADLIAAQDTVFNVNATETAQPIMMTETAAQATLLALSWTPPPPAAATPDPLQAALDTARSFVGSNTDWQAQYPDGFRHTFADGVTMVLVPAGSFIIGANPQQTNEHNGSVITFSEPFWIDLTEVTQADFMRLGGVKANTNRFAGDQRPVETITWFEAHDFCALRGARLPTEAEWEYAARGPAQWSYPWGDSWNASSAVWNRSRSQGTANAAGLPAGRTWVGVFDMIGNAWEWTSSLYLPYTSPDNREAAAENRTDVHRVLRGGSWGFNTPVNLRAANRLRHNPSLSSPFFGFRCARSG